MQEMTDGVGQSAGVKEEPETTGRTRLVSKSGAVYLQSQSGPSWY
jgi:hypothetical protein